VLQIFDNPVAISYNEEKRLEKMMEEKIYAGSGNILYVYKILKKYTDADHPLTVNQIVKLIQEEFEETISGRTVRRNFQVLTEKFGLCIERIDDAYYLDYEDYDLDFSEVRCLVDLIQYSNFIDDSFAKELSHKLIHHLNENEQKDFEGYQKYMRNTKTNNKEVFYTIKSLTEAMKQKKYVHFDYYKYNVHKEFKFRKAFYLFPLTILCDIGQYYLVAADQEKSLFYFRLDRIKNLEIKDGSPLKIPKQQLEEYIQSTVGMYGGKEEKVKAKVSIRLLDDVMDQFGKDAKISEYNSEYFLMEATVNLEGFKQWALRHIEKVQILEPASFQNEIASILEEALKKYSH